MDAQDGGDRMFCVFSFLHLPMHPSIKPWLNTNPAHPVHASLQQTLSTHPSSKPLLNTNPVFGTLGHIDSVAWEKHPSSGQKLSAKEATQTFPGSQEEKIAFGLQSQQRVDGGESIRV